MTDETARCGDWAVWTPPMSRLLLPTSQRGLPKTSVVMHVESIGSMSLLASFGVVHVALATASTRTPGVAIVPFRGVTSAISPLVSDATNDEFSPGASVSAIGRIRPIAEASWVPVGWTHVSASEVNPVEVLPHSSGAAPG